MRSQLLVVISLYFFCQLNLAVGLSSIFFIDEPPNVITFSNNSGGIVQCRAGGTPQPTITWKWSEHELNAQMLQDFKNEIMIRSDGSLVFAPFPAYRYKKEIHLWAKFQCIATNKHGSIGSRETRVNAVMAQKFEVGVYDEFVIKGNVAVLKCQIEPSVSNFITSFYWHFSDGFSIKANETKGKYTVYPGGELHVRSVDESDSHKTYRCEAKNGLNNESEISKAAAQLIVTESRNLLPPRVVHRISEIVVEDTEQNVMIACACEANPLPQYSWHKTSKFGTISAIQMSESSVVILDGTLLLKRVTVADSGRYMAIVSNSVGEERCITDLIVRSGIKSIITPNGMNGVLQMTRKQSVNISCRVQGFPVDSVKWTHNLKTISFVSNPSDRTTAIRIESLQANDAGIYQCFAYNRFESTQSSVQILLIDEAPHITHTFEEKVLNVGNSLTLRCAATGRPLSQIYWLIDGRTIPNFMRYRTGDYVTNDNKVISYVNISSVRYEDGGVYRCIANNSVGTAHYQSRINVFGTPAIKPMPNVTFLSGDTGYLFCPYYGYPISSIDWLSKDGRTLPINGRQMVFTNGTLAINNINKKSDEGVYECMVKHDTMVARSSTYVKVMVGPRIDRFSFPQSLEEGMRNVVICAVLAGDPPISIKWLKDGKNLPNDLQPEMVNEFTSSITFSSLKPQHSGEYTCIASNNAAVTNHSSLLSVNVSPYWIKEPKDVETVVGQTAVIDCQAGGIPEPQIIWKQMQLNDDSIEKPLYINGNNNNNKLSENFKTITSNPHIQILENGSLVIKEVNKYDAKKYICNAFNGVNPSLSSIIELRVNSPPQFQERFQSISVKKGDVIRLECNPIIDNKERIEFQWKKNSISINFNTAEQYREEIRMAANATSNLIVASVQRYDSSIFTCAAINRFGSDEKRFRVIVQEVPDPPFDLKSKLITSNSATIAWSQPYNGNSPISEYRVEYKLASVMSWTDSINVHTITTLDTSAILRNLLPMSSYHIRVCATNSLGSSLLSDAIIITTLEEAPSLPPLDVTVVTTGARYIKVSWKTPKSASISIKGYYVGYRAHNSDGPFIFKTIDASHETDHEEYQINNLVKHTKYEVRIQAFNSAGSGPPSKDIIGQTLEFDIPNAPFVKVLATTSHSMELELNVFGDEPVLGYIIFYRGEDKQWNESKISFVKTHTIYGLKCGSRYQIYVTAFNSAGQGDSSDVISVRTEGNAPIAPEKSHIVKPNSTFVTLYLNSWQNIGCAINNFVVQYKKQFDSDWIFVSSSLISDTDELIIDSLTPGMWYNLIITANSDAGYTEAEYLFSTYTHTGATISPFSAQTGDHIDHQLFHISGSGKWLLNQLNFVIPISCAILIVILVTVVICILQYKNSGGHHHQEIGSPSSVDESLMFKHDSDMLAAANKERNCTRDSFVEINTNLNQNKSASIYLPTPYATSRVSYIAQSDDSECNAELIHQSLGQSSKHFYDVPFIMKRMSTGETDKQYGCANKSVNSLIKSDSFNSKIDEFHQLKSLSGSGQSSKNLFF